MLPKINRLKKSKDFKRIFKEGRIFRGELLDLRLTDNGLNICRFGFLIGLRVSKKATLRNKIRRRLAEIIKFSLNDINLGHDLVIIAKEKIANANFEEITRDLKNVIKKAKINN